MIHVSVDVYLRKNKVPETSTQPLRVFISRARTQQSSTGVVGNYKNHKKSSFLLFKGRNYHCLSCNDASIRTSYCYKNTASIFTVLLFELKPESSTKIESAAVSKTFERIFCLLRLQRSWAMGDTAKLLKLIAQQMQQQAQKHREDKERQQQQMEMQ